MPQPTQLRRALATTPVAMPAAGLVGELAWAIGSFTDLPQHVIDTNDLIISDGTAHHVMVGPTRQVELVGDQTITGLKTFSLTSLSITGGAPGETLSTDGAGLLSWATAATIAEPVGAGTWGRLAAGTWERSVAVSGDEMTGGLTLASTLTFTGAPIAAPATVDEVWSSGGVLIKTLAPPTAAGANINIIAQDSAATANNGGSIFITTGTAAADAGYGGTLTLRSGDGGTEAGSINLYGGDGIAAGSNGGQVRLAAGDGLQEGGPVSLLAGDGDVEGGSVIITAGDGATLGGAIELRAGGPNGEIRIYNQAIVQLGIPFTLGTVPIDPMHAATKQYVDSMSTTALRFAGSYDASTDLTDPVGAGVAGPLPVSDATNVGQYYIVTVGGAGLGNAVAEGPYAPEDWLISSEVPTTAGTYAWHKLSVGAVAMTAGNIAITPIAGMTATNVQEALEELAARVVTTDTISLTGNGTSTTPLSVALIDGGVF